ncbi:tRNA (adenosine(37)-N6)-threonylcarbamoyltransferase complex ATPase subunit type 1 TsaE [Patescibacteria group bacterium]|nr:tRNA (adenosine(37)-N6)-threonylcarbamoyltransferase complex ATPase subunit type 1 TsaE [Patescibacteria group bacterium]MBU2613552.1 tRNA (adenosine(37)-N6)-threonylcarbamoyltransferase complex ATPase subunit type 1 TsaE [Patescibacteria group bacterium]
MRMVTIHDGADCKRFRVPSASDWGDLAAYVASTLKPGDILALSGPLGAGKTTFVQALAKALGATRVPRSPTFALIRSYPLHRRGPLKRLVHVDAYRIEHPSEILALDLDEELADGKTAVAIEWPENIKGWLKRKKTIRVDIKGA